MMANQPKRKPASSWILVLTGCVLIGLATAALLGSRLRGASKALAAQQQAPGASLRLVNAGTQNSSLPALSEAAQRRVSSGYANLPLVFEANQGQTDAQVKYLARGAGYTLFLTADEAVLSMATDTASGPKQAMQRKMAGFSKRKNVRRRSRVIRPSNMAVLRMRMNGANPHPQIAGNDILPGISNYFIGNDPRLWRTNVPQYSRVKYQDVYPGVNLAFHGEQHQLEFDFVVAGGADPSPINLSFSGARRLATDASGDLVLSTSAGDLRLHKPVAYQEENGARHLVDARFVLKDDKRVSFALGNYDRSRELVIDPALSYSTYLGGAGEDEGFGIALDGNGNAYVTGETTSASFPKGGSGSPNGGFDAFVVKVNSSGTALVYSTFFGGAQDELGSGVAVDASGNAYVAGITNSALFPVMNAAQPTFGGGLCGTLPCNDAFMAKFDPTGVILYATFLGGSNSDSAFGIALDASNNAYIAGETFSTDFNTKNSIQLFNLGLSTTANDGFVAKINPAGSGAASLIYSTYLGGSNGDLVTGIAVLAGNAYVTGDTISTDFPTTASAFDKKCGTDGTCNASGGILFDDAFVTEINSAGSALMYSTYLGGSGTDIGLGIAADSTGAYVTGFTKSTDFPTKAPFQTSNNAPATANAFVTKLNTTGSALTYSSFLGGSTAAYGIAIAADAKNNAYVTGSTLDSDFPLVDAFQTTPHGNSDAFVTEVNPAGAALVYSTYLGGSGDENFDATTGQPFGGGIAVASTSGAVVVTGLTTSSANDFPTTAGVVQNTYGGGVADAFVTSFTPAQQSSPDFSVNLNPASVSVVHGQTTSAITVTVAGLNGGFNNAVTLSCSGLPAHAACSSFNPASVTPANGSQTSTFTIATNAASAQLVPPSNPRRGLFYAVSLPLAGLALLGTGWGSRKRKLLGLLLACLVFSSLVVLPACSSGGGGGGGGGGTTPPGTYQIDVTGTSGSTTHTAILTLNVT